MARPEKTEKQIKKGKLLASRIKTARIGLDFTQQKLAQESGLSIDTIRKIEGGRVAAPSVFVVFQLAKVLNAQIGDWLK